MMQATQLEKRIAERVAESQRNRQAAATAAGESPAAAAKPATTADPHQPATRKGDRWATFNAFMDVIAPRLTLAERAVWLLMFRHARGGTCETSVRMLAAGAAIGRATAERALRQLSEYGLVRAVWKSRDKSRASKYAVHPQPDRCIGNLPSSHEPSSP